MTFADCSGWRGQALMQGEPRARRKEDATFGAVVLPSQTVNQAIAAEASPVWVRTSPRDPAQLRYGMTPTAFLGSCIRLPSGTVPRWFRNRHTPFRLALSDASSKSAHVRQGLWWVSPSHGVMVVAQTFRASGNGEPLVTSTAVNVHSEGNSEEPDLITLPPMP